MSVPGKLFVVATPIGNPEDLTPRAARILGEADIVACEEWKEGRRLMREVGVEAREMTLVNEHTELEAIDELLAALGEGKSVALVSDCGTPALADPGTALIVESAARGINVVPVPGVSSFVAALMVSGFPVNQFVFRGLLSAKTDERTRELRALRTEARTVILFDAPYRLERLVNDVAGAFPERQAVLAMDLTTSMESIHRGACRDLAAIVKGKHWKREFVIVLGPQPTVEHFPRHRVR